MQLIVNPQIPRFGGVIRSLAGKSKHGILAENDVKLFVLCRSPNAEPHLLALGLLRPGFLEQLCLQSLSRHWSRLPAILKENCAATRMLQVSIDAARPPHRVSKTSSDCKLGQGTDVDDKE